MKSWEEKVIIVALLVFVGSAAGIVCGLYILPPSVICWLEDGSIPIFYNFSHGFFYWCWYMFWIMACP